MTKKTIISKGKEQTQQIGEVFAEELGKTRIVALYGDLGSGKTTFIQGLAKGLGVEQRLISPTFIIVRSYELSLKRPGLLRLTSLTSFYHIDLYRIEHEKEVEGLGIDEILSNKNSVVAIEWAEKMEDLLPKKRWNIYFEHLSENERKIMIEKNAN